MRPNFCLTILHVFILAATLLTLEADIEDECLVWIRVHRNTKYIAPFGEELRIKCPVHFCNDPPPTISWMKYEETEVPVNVSQGSHFRTEWTTLTSLEGESVLIIQNLNRNDSGVYWCQSPSTVGHKINVSVNVCSPGVIVARKTHKLDLRLDLPDTETVENPTEARTTSEPRSPETEEHLWPFVYPVCGIMGLVVMVIIVYVTSDSIRKCVRGRTKETPDPSSQTSNKAQPTDHDYENVQ